MGALKEETARECACDTARGQASVRSCERERTQGAAGARKAGSVIDERAFKVLVALVDATDAHCDVDSLARRSGLSTDEAARALASLREREVLGADATARDDALAALEPFRVRRAVLLAAGFGSRLAPLTLKTPKPLIRVRGVRIIDTLIDAVTAAGIDEIYVVRGYLADQFDQLLEKYPSIRFVDNPLFEESNNISSALAARDKLGGSYVFESDLLLRAPQLVSRYQYASNYLGVPVDATDDWCLPSRDGVITGMELGGKNCHHMFGLSYWTVEDGEKLAEDIPRVFAEPGGRDLFWDKVPLERCADRYRIRVRDCTFDDVIEIDTVAELASIDPAYA